jgi:hypothetical protein
MLLLLLFGMCCLFGAGAGQYVGDVVVLDVDDMKTEDLIDIVDGMRIPVRVKALNAGNWSFRKVCVGYALVVGRAHRCYCTAGVCRLGVEWGD